MTEKRRHDWHRQPRVLTKGDLFVTGTGEFIIKEPLKRTRALLVRSIEAVKVAFNELDPPCPPCNPHNPDELNWKLVERGHELFLCVYWRVSCGRTIHWVIFEVD